MKWLKYGTMGAAILVVLYYTVREWIGVYALISTARARAAEIRRKSKADAMIQRIIQGDGNGYAGE